MEKDTKTAAEIKGIVLAECERLLKFEVEGNFIALPAPYEKRNMYIDWSDPVEAKQRDDLEEIQGFDWDSYKGDESQGAFNIRIGGGSVFLPINMGCNNQEWFAAYRLLGLEARDAVEAERDRANGLVEFAESIFKSWGNRSIGRHANNALQAYKEGGGND